jgi:hypothetical protein
VQTELPLRVLRGLGIEVSEPLTVGTVCNTVLDSQVLAVHPDWITLRVLTPDPGQSQDLVALVGATLNDVFEYIPGPHRIAQHNTTYDWMAVSAKGIRAYWHNPGNGLKSHGRISTTRLEFGGKVLNSCNAVDLRDLMALLYNNDQAACVRFDIAGDDYSKELWNWHDVDDAARVKNFSGFDKRNFNGDYDTAPTIYFGSRKSEAMYRFYDKNVESGGVINANRMEIELKRSKAHQAFVAWLQPPAGDEQMAAQILAEFLVGNIDFIDRSEGDKNLDRCPRLAWWQAVLDVVGRGVKLSPIYAVATIQKSADWLVFRVAPTLAMLERRMGDAFQDFLSVALAWGRDHQTSRHERLLQVAELEGWEYGAC